MNPEQQVPSSINYTFLFANGEEWHYEVNLLEVDTLEQDAPADKSPRPDWTRLSFQQCSNCPLNAEESPRCPYAAALAGPVAALADRASHELVEMRVNWREREVRQTTTLQRAAGSLLGAIGGVSGCPHMSKLKSMAWFHQPFSMPDESLYRVLSTYLLGQHLRYKRGLSADWDLDGLREMYRELRKVNRGMSARLLTAAEQDSSLNGLILLDLLAADMLYSLERDGDELDRFFAAYIDDAPAG